MTGNKILILLTGLLLCVGYSGMAQENIAPIQYNPYVQKGGRHSSAGTMRTTALGLPFFEDFTSYGADPDTSRWVERQVYINNTMGANMISRGVATFDALSEHGIPYDPASPGTIRYADSLTVKAIDLSTYLPSDSIYLSFFYQPAGNGFAPEKQDSLMLFFRSKSGGKWIKVWSKSDTVLQEFRQVMIPVRDTNYFYSGFQFRFINKASVGINDDVWNLDYIRMGTGRNRYDTVLNDVAYTNTPTTILSDYYAMPYRHYIAKATAERATNFQTTIRNNYLSSQTVTDFGYTANVESSGTFLSSGSDVNRTIPSLKTSDVVFGTYSSTPGAGAYEKVVLDNKFYLVAPPGDTYKENDTIIGSQVFDNYLAYDDGTAEMSYYLNLFPTLPGKLAIEHHLNQPDTLRGLAIYFGRQVPLATYKYFSIVVYRTIAYGSSSSDDVLYETDDLKPQYMDTVNHFWVYKFDKPVLLPAGTFYIGTTQPAMSGSDSLYIGLDRNRLSSNHLYYNVLDRWSPSLVSGALMMRPLLGAPIKGSGIAETTRTNTNEGFSISPNPATDQILIRTETRGKDLKYEVRNLLGIKVREGQIREGRQSVDVSDLAPGIYLVQLSTDNALFSTQKFLKQ